MKKFSFIFIMLLLIIGTYLFKEPIAKMITLHLLKENQKMDVIINNAYAKNDSYQYVKLTNQFSPKNKEDLMNIFFTVLTSGMEEFTFFCDEDYSSCINDVDFLSENQALLSSMNGFISPFNSFSNIKTTRYEATGKIKLNITKKYNQEKQEKIEAEVNQRLKELITENMSTKDKIKKIHDYIIEKTKYDTKRSDEQITEYNSATADGPLFEGYGICSGYSDAMMLFLDKLNIPNYKITSENHIWNFVYVEDAWYHLDLTWDDPILDSGKEIIDYDYFLITTKELHELKDNQHYFNEAIYLEAK